MLYFPSSQPGVTRLALLSGEPSLVQQHTEHLSERMVKINSVTYLKFGKNKKMDYFREAPERNAVLLTL